MSGGPSPPIWLSLPRSTFTLPEINQTLAACRAFNRLIAVVKTDGTDFLVDANDLTGNRVTVTDCRFR